MQKEPALYGILEKVATGSYNLCMNHNPPVRKDSGIVSIKEAKNRLSEIVRRVEAGETVTLTRNGKPVADIVQPKKKGGIDFEAGRAWLRARGITDPIPYIADDFDDPLPEDFLITPLPPASK